MKGDICWDFPVESSTSTVTTNGNGSGPLTFEHDSSSMSRRANILDEIHPTLPPEVWDDPGGREPSLKPEHAHFIKTHIYHTLDSYGYKDPHTWLNLVLTGSLTTYQYGPTSDVDVSLFINASVLPEWSRAEMISLMVTNCDGHKLPGTPYPLQCFVVNGGINKGDLYRPGLRSGYDIDTMHWIVPPDPKRAHNVAQQENGFYTWALEVADKMERLLRYEPHKAEQFWHAIHRRRKADEEMGKGDFSESNIIYKFLAQRGLMPELEKVTGERVGRTASQVVKSDLDHQSVLDANAGQDLQGLPGPVNVPGYGPLQFHSNADIQRMANEYNQQYGIQSQHPTDYTRVNPQIAAQVANAFEQTPHSPNDPQTHAAYDAFARETRQQYDHIVNNGYRFHFYPQGQDPYPNSPREAMLDLHHNKHMYVFPTHEGFGAEGDAPETADHPMLADSGVRWGGQPVTHNDLFRAVHDVFGHAKEGVGFRGDGEDNAFRQHSAMFSPLAQRALTTETRGQNNWVNHGPYGEHNQTANTADTIFAQNRAGLMPEWVSNPDLFKQPSQTFAKVAAYQPITRAEARGNSRPVSYEEFQQLAAEGHRQHDALAAHASPTIGLDNNWGTIKEHAHQQVLQPWGGATYDAHTGQPLESDADLYALTARPPGVDPVTTPESPDRATFHNAMDEAKARFQPILEREGHYLGVFHDNDQQRVDIDPILVVGSPQDVETIGAYTHATGGAYHFATGQGHFVPHVVDLPQDAVRGPSETTGVLPGATGTPQT